MPRVPAQSVQLDNDWRQRLKKEEARLNKTPVAPDPFSRSLSAKLAAEGKCTTARTPQEVQAEVALTAKKLAERPSASAINGARGGSSTISHARGSSLSQRTLSALGGQSAMRTGSAIAGEDVRSNLSGSSQYRPPSSIRSSEPSTIARNKIAELQLRLELERVVRLERENELETQRRRNLERQAGR
uniref:Uncharacterized protein n=1 Tax=Coccolithus braarudii TaxID=221442 RepID=A0A7S0Q169_9EUKA|mmetsp:Transcript_31190/g.67003  ORF Transcript_31190/g.67003 Transcript_31190/m.67003 type:complete len:187 (+) Transcript_31190:159-719(+)